MFTSRKYLPVALLAALTGTAGCFDFMGPDLDWGSGFGGCTTNCEAPTTVAPWSANVLRGDTVRFSACGGTQSCYLPNSTGNVPSKWTVPDSSVAELLGGESAILVPAATSVLVRGVAPGRVTVAVTFSKGGSSYYVPQVSIRVADSSDIKSIELPLYGSDSLRASQTRIVGLQLRDVGGTIFRGAPTSLTSSDTTILRVTLKAGYQGATEISVVGLSPGKASVTATFLGVTATRVLTVVP